MKDRRTGDRTPVDAQRRVTVLWQPTPGAGEEILGAAADMSNSAVAVRIAGDLDPVVGQRLRAVRLVCGDVMAQLGEAVVVRVEGGHGSAIVAVLGLTRPRDLDALWDFRDRYRRPTSTLPVPLARDRPEPVPGRGHYSEAARLERLDWLRQRTGAGLESYTEVPFEADSLTGNIENLVGAVSVPVGIAGPLRISGDHARGDVVAPFATTEGALVASATRGALAVSRSGGVRVQVLHQVMTRAPAFSFDGVAAAAAFGRWLEDHHDDIAAAAAAVSSHARLLALEPYQVGATVHVRFAFDTADAAGQNMTTACTSHATNWILSRLAEHPTLRPTHFMVEGNLSGDKKLNWVSPVAGRGVRVSAAARIPGDVLLEVLKVTPEQIVRGFHVGLGGTLASGTAGYDINVANAIAAIFTATGQDIACVHESAVAVLDLQERHGALEASMLLPCLVIGTVGGGTHLPAQRDALRVLGCDGPGHVGRLAEIIAGFCLALDLSTLAAVCGGQFVAAHERLGRNRPIAFLSRDDLVPAFFAPAVRTHTGDPDAEAVSAEPVAAHLEDSILSEITSHRVRHMVGLHPYRLGFRTPGPAGATASTDVVVKVKPVDRELQLLMRSLASACGDEVADALAAHEDRLAFKGSHLRELAVYEQTDPRFRSHAPRHLMSLRDDEREAYVLVLELLRPDVDVALLNSVGNSDAWNAAAIDIALRGAAELHSIWWGRDAEVLGDETWAPEPNAADMKDMLPLWRALADHAAGEFPALVDARARRRCDALHESIGDWWSEAETQPRTLTHGDFNPRNICLRRGGGADRRLCAFDWELACWHLPQRDLAELLAFTLPADVEQHVVDAHADVHRRALAAATGATLDPGTWQRGYQLGLYDFVVNRLMLYLMGHTVRDFSFLPAVCATAWRLLEIEAARGAPELAGTRS